MQNKQKNKTQKQAYLIFKDATHNSRVVRFLQASFTHLILKKKEISVNRIYSSLTFSFSNLKDAGW